MPIRRTMEMQRGRTSSAENVYFVTCCTKGRRRNLTDPAVAGRLVDVAKASDGVGDSLTFGFTAMPDHVHWFFRLSARLSIGQSVAKFKSVTRANLQLRDLAWQRNYFEHRLRPDESPEDYALYVFLNPYRAGLIEAHRVWPHWWSGEPASLGFVSLLNADGSPPPEWIDLPIPDSVRHGE